MHNIHVLSPVFNAESDINEEDSVFLTTGTGLASWTLHLRKTMQVRRKQNQNLPPAYVFPEHLSGLFALQ